MVEYNRVNDLSDELMKNQNYTAGIDGYSSDGAGVCHINGRAVFVPGALRGEIWETKILKVIAAAGWAKGVSCLRAAPARAEAACAHFGKCGGCALLHMDYGEELRFKTDRVNDALRRLGGLDLSISEIIPADLSRPSRYKVIFAVGERDGEPVTGYLRHRSHDIIPVIRCMNVPDVANRAAAAVHRFMRSRRIPAYDETSGRQGVRHVFVRSSHKSGEAMICLVSSVILGREETRALVGTLRFACPEAASIVFCLNKRRGNTVLAGEFHTLYGDDAITDELCGLRFALSPQTFFQVNPPQAEKLYAQALEYALPEPSELVLDLYCGAGAISLCLAKRARHVIGAEIVPQAVADAKANAERNGAANAEFLCADAGEASSALVRRGMRPDVIVLDPPRKGLDASVVDAVVSMRPARVVYVSCDPGTLARDLRRFTEQGYAPTAGKLVDMFPHTHHVETIVLMSRKDK